MEVVQRPWGNYQQLYVGVDFQVKRIEVNAGAKFSLQKHLQRAEKWIIVSGTGIATVGETPVNVGRGSFVDIQLGQVHRMENTCKEPLIFIEVQFGAYLGEDDIVRFQDDFGRV